MREKVYEILVTIKVRNRIVAINVRCRIEIPLKIKNKPSIKLHLTKKQYDRLNYVFEFSIYGKNYPDLAPFEIRAETVYRIKDENPKWKHKSADYVILGEPKNIEFQMPLTWSKNLREVIFRLTPNKLLNSQRIGKKIIAATKLKPAKGLSIRFENHYKYYTNAENEDVSFSELVVVCRLSSKFALDEKEVFTQYIEDILWLASLAERHRCACLGWKYFNKNVISNFYRGDTSIPDDKKELYNELIDIGNIEEYFQLTIKNLHKLEFKENIRRTIMLIVPSRETVESEFLSLFTALETLVLGFRRWKQREFVFTDNAEWNKFNSDFRNWIKKESSIKNDSHKRGLIYENATALQRVSFNTVFSEMCDYYSIDLSDLWSVNIRENKEWSLTDIRNNLVHGNPFKDKYFSWKANEHLRWTVERLILAVLGWEISKSNVSSTKMSHLTAYNSWKDDRAKMSKS